MPTASIPATDITNGRNTHLHTSLNGSVTSEVVMTEMNYLKKQQQNDWMK